MIHEHPYFVMMKTLYALSAVLIALLSNVQNIKNQYVV